MHSVGDSPTTVKEVEVHPCRVHSCWSSPKMRFLLDAVAVKCIAPHVKESGFLPSYFFFRIQNRGKFSLWNPESDYRLESRKLVPPTKTCTVQGAGTNGVGSRIQQYLGFHYVGQRHRTGSPNTKKNFAKRKSTKQNKLIWQTTHTMVPKFKSFLDTKNHSRCSCWSTVEQTNDYIN